MISTATFEDIAQLDTLINSAYRGESSKKGWTTEADLLGGIRTDAEGLKLLLSNPNAVILKHTDQEQITGCVFLENQGHQLYLGMLTVSPVLQGGGLGKKLLAAAEAQARAWSLPKIGMTVISARQELIDWYERRGYHQTGETRPFPMNDAKFGLPKQFLEFVVMEKEVAF